MVLFFILNKDMELKIFIDPDPGDNCTNIILINTSCVTRNRYLRLYKIDKTRSKYFLVALT